MPASANGARRARRPAFYSSRRQPGDNEGTKCRVGAGSIRLSLEGALCHMRAKCKPDINPTCLPTRADHHGMFLNVVSMLDRLRANIMRNQRRQVGARMVQAISPGLPASSGCRRGANRENGRAAPGEKCPGERSVGGSAASPIIKPICRRRRFRLPRGELTQRNPATRAKCASICGAYDLGNALADAVN